MGRDMKRDTIGPSLAAVHIACADLILAGFRAVIAPEGLAYDALLDAHGTLYRVQVKSTSKAAPRRSNSSENVYRFSTTRNHRPEIHGQSARIRQYSATEVDIIACVAIDIRHVAYFPVTGQFISGLHLYPPSAKPWIRNGHSQRRIITDFPISGAIGRKHSGPPTLAYGPQ